MGEPQGLPLPTVDELIAGVTPDAVLGIEPMVVGFERWLQLTVDGKPLLALSRMSFLDLLRQRAIQLLDPSPRGEGA